MPLEERVATEFAQAVTIDLHALFLGKRLGGGLSREVFEFVYDSRFVVKVETESHFQNVTEYTVWEAVKDTEWAKWFAPVKLISPLGTTLIMRRAVQAEDAPAKAKVNFPRMLPDFLADSRMCNWGWLDGRWVMIDYGFTRLLSKGFKRVRMVHGDKVASTVSGRKAVSS